MTWRAWGEANEERLRLYVGLRNGVPGHDTIRRVFEAIDPKQLELVLLEWVGQVCPTLGKVLAIDGKSMRGSGSVVRAQRALHVVSTYASELGLVLGQQRCDEKSNAITAIEALLPHLKLAEAIEEYIGIGAQHAWKNLAPAQFESLDKGHGCVAQACQRLWLVPDNGTSCSSSLMLTMPQLEGLIPKLEQVIHTLE